MINVSFWSEERQAYYCQWDNGDGYLNESDLAYEAQQGEEVVWHCSAAE
ncbi:hypothetical protein VA249_45280 (plasmid) [Vibrio alfacsensis]|nr:hypothetical protein [Vibrio alfacsensis]BBM67882.1 hypothetical protein VA249_45280 [Vibrio alfacsensis]